MLGIVVQVRGSMSESEDSVSGVQLVEYCGVGMGMAGSEGMSEDKWLDKQGREVI